MDKITWQQKEAARQQAFHCLERADREAARQVIAEYHNQNRTPADLARRARREALRGFA